MAEKGEMRDQIVAICAEALARRGFVDVDHARLFHDPVMARAFLALLRDCPPLPVVTALIREVEAASGG